VDQTVSTGDIAISDVFRKFWHNRGLFIIFPVLFAAIAAAALAAGSLRLHSPIVYYIGLKGIQDGKYQNGAVFSPNDLLVPQVIDSVAQQFAIDDRSALRQAFQVRYGSVLEAGLGQKYRRSLANRNLTTTELDAINSRYAAELSETVRSGLRIDFDYLALGLDKETGKAVAAALPEAWTRIYPRLFKIILDTRLQGVTVPRNATTLDSASSLLFASQAIRNLRRGLTLISQDDRLNSVTTGQGSNSADLMQDLDRFETQYFDPLFRTVKADDPVSETYRRQTELEILNQQRQLAGYNTTISDLQSFRGVRPNLDAGSAGTTSFGAGGASGLQLNESGINEISRLVRRATLADYLTEVLNKRQDKLVEISELQKDLAMLTSPLPGALDDAFRESAARQFSSLVEQYTELLGLSRQRLAAAVSQMYVPAASPTVVGTLLPPRSLLLLGLSVLLGLIAAGIASMLRPDRKNAATDRAPAMVVAVSN
jgi:hypothetical protein